MSKSPTPRQRQAAIYRAAARLIERGKLLDPGGGSCSAITQVSLPRVQHSEAYDRLCGTPIVTNYIAMFRPEQPDYAMYWGRDWSATDQERDDCRIVALCFMAAMVEAGDA